MPQNPEASLNPKSRNPKPSPNRLPNVLPQLQLSEPALIGIAAIALYAFWRFCRLVVAWGYFILFFVIGSLAAWAYMPDAPLGMPMAFGAIFAGTVAAMRAKIFKLVMGAAIAAATYVAGPKLVDMKKDWEADKKAKLTTSQKAPKPKN